MNNQMEQFNNLLIIMLIVLCTILLVLTVVYLVLKKKEKEPLKDKKENIKINETTDEKQNVNSKNSTQLLNKQSIMDFMEFDKIEDNMIIKNGGKRFIMAIECQGINYDLMSEMEKTAVEEGFIQFLNTLRHPIQIYVQTRTVNLADSIQRYKTSLNDVEMELNKKQLQYDELKKSNASQEQIDKAFYELTKKKNLFEYGKDIIKNTENMSLNKNVLNKKYYIIISHYPEEVGKEEYAKDEIQNIAFSELYTKAQSIIRTLYACNVNGRILNSYDLVELLYNAYNREEEEIFNLDKALKAGYEELYSTAPDVFKKKEKILDDQIKSEAFKLAKEQTNKAKSESQKRYEEKSNSMGQLIREMAQLIIEENKQYIGNDIANEAIENIDKMIEDEKGGDKDVKQEKTKTRRKSN